MKRNTDQEYNNSNNPLWAEHMAYFLTQLGLASGIMRILILHLTT